jgi:hypothetical protein
MDDSARFERINALERFRTGSLSQKTAIADSAGLTSKRLIMMRIEDFAFDSAKLA